MVKVEAIIPAYNEGDRIGGAIRGTKLHVDRIIVVDDGSTDGTAEISRKLGADVIAHRRNRGYLEAIKTGFRALRGDIAITIDADGESDPGDIPKLVKPIVEKEVDLVLGKRKHVPRLSERFIDFLTSFTVGVSDTGTGFRALKTSLAKRLKLHGKCPCGTLVLEVASLGGRMEEVPVRTRKVGKPMKIAWKHALQIFYVLKLLMRAKRPTRT